MKSKIDKKQLIHKILGLGGFHAFMLTLGLTHPLVIFTCVIMTTVLVIKFKYKKSYMHLMFPLASGLLLFPMKLFYWDRADYLCRVENLLVIAWLFCFLVLLRHFGTGKKFLRYFGRLPLKKRLLFIFVTAEILFIIASFLMIQQGVRLGGDEPHYLVIAQSIAQDGDINVFNQYARETYREFIDSRVRHHARVGKGFKKWYSYGHLPGLSLTLAPFFLAKLPNLLLYFLVRAYLGLFGAMLAVVAYLFALKLWNHKNLALFVTAAFTLSAPVFFYAIHIFAELQASLLILTSLYLLLYAGYPRKKETRVLLAGLLMGMTVFWGLKFVILIFLLCAGFFVRFVIKKEVKTAILFALFPLLFQILFFGFLHYAYGNFDPMSLYNGVMTAEQEQVYRSGVKQIPLQKRVETVLGLFLDQRDGLLLYAPFYLLALPGLILAIRKYRLYWPHLLIGGAGFAFILFMGYSSVRAGYCPQARYMVPAAWLMMLFAVIYYRETSNRWFKKIALYLPLYGFLVVAYQVIYPFTLYQSVTHINLNRPGLMFQQWGNIYMNPSEWLPSFVKVPGNFNYLPNIIFLVLLLVFILLALKTVKKAPALWMRRGFSIVSFAILAILFALFPKVPNYNPILQIKDNNPALACKIYGESTYPTRVNERTFELKEKYHYSFTVSTLKPVPSFIFKLRNNDKNSYRIKISNFDQVGVQGEVKAAESLEINSGSVQTIVMPHPRYKQYSNAMFYRFHVNVESSGDTSGRYFKGASRLFLQIYPDNSAQAKVKH